MLYVWSLSEFSSAVCRDRNAGIQRSRPVELGDALLRRRAEQRQPQAAVGGEALLRREVIGIHVGYVDRQAAGAGCGVDQHERLTPLGGALDRRHHARRSLVVRPRDHVGAASAAAQPTAAGSGASPGSAVTTTGSPRNGALGADRGELLRELTEGQVRRTLARRAERGRVPERGRAAVAERDLVPIGQREQLAQARANPRDERLDRLLAMRGAHHARALCGQTRRAPGAHLRRAAAETAVGRLELVGDDELRLCRAARRHVGLLARSDLEDCR